MKSVVLRDVGLLAMRLVVGFIFVWHGAEKFFYPGVGVDKFVNMGFPGFLGPVIGGLEVVGALLLVVGFQVRYVSVVLAGIIFVALVGVQLPQGFQAGLERDLLILGAALILFAYGSGKLALRPDDSAAAQPQPEA